MSCDYIYNLSTGIWEELGEPDALSVASISGRLLSSGFLGQLDIQINGCHFIDSGNCVAPSLSNEEQAIYEQLYLVNYYKKTSTQVISLNQGMNAALWTRIDEGDTKISRSDPVSLAKFYRDLYNTAQLTLDRMVDQYRNNLSTPKSVDYFNIENLPNSNTQTWGHGGQY